MKNFKLFLVFFICFIVQSTLLSHFSILGVSPNLILVLLMVFSFYFEDYSGIVFGVIFGIMQDIAFGQVIGFSAFIYFCIGMALKYVCIRVYRDNVDKPQLEHILVGHAFISQIVIKVIP